MSVEELVILQTVVGVAQKLISGRTPTEDDTKALIDAEHKLRDSLAAKIEADIAAKEAAEASKGQTAPVKP